MYFISHYVLKYNSTLWRQTLCVCNAQGDAQNAKRHVNISVVMHGAFKFHFSAHHYGHMFLIMSLVSLFFIYLYISSNHACHVHFFFIYEHDI
jgi:hypothetical protein